MQKEFIQLTLKNGIRVIHKQTTDEVAHCGIIINAGSRDEGENEQGIAHLIEHVLFKGTKKRKAFHILNRIDSVGGELNAYTTKEETCIYASFLARYFECSVELISDIAFHSTFPDKEIKKEKAVIVDEINSYLDNPSEQIFDDFDEQQSHHRSRQECDQQVDDEAVRRRTTANATNHFDHLSAIFPANRQNGA